MKQIIVTLPAYNEEENVETLVQEWMKYKEPIAAQYGLELKIAIINDGSADRTREIGERLQQEYSDVKLVNHEQNKGLGEAVKTGLLYSLSQGAHFTCLMDCDNTHDPKYVLSMLNKQKQDAADVVIASRYQKGAEVKGVSPFRLLTSEGAKAVYSLILGVKGVKDYTCGYRLYRNEFLEKAYDRFGDDLIEESGFTCMAELLYKLARCGAKFAEVPFELRYDFKKGASKMRVVKTAVDSIRLAFHLRRSV